MEEEEEKEEEEEGLFKANAVNLKVDSEREEVGKREQCSMTIKMYV